jgi:hypothetical protein
MSEKTLGNRGIRPRIPHFWLASVSLTIGLPPPPPIDVNRWLPFPVADRGGLVG